jgi:hypothetical protein
MKFGLMLLLLPLFCDAQEIALLDRHFKKPVLYTNSLQGDALYRCFPVYRADLDSVIQVTETLLSSVQAGKPPEPDAVFLPAGHSFFAVRTWKTGAYTNYFVVLSTRSGDKGATLELLSEQDGNKKAAQKLLVFLDYLKNNRHLTTTEPLP